MGESVCEADKSPLISVIVPVYKVEPYLRRCVDSILSQTYTNLEIILVDDGSPDKCPAICDEYSVSDSRVKVIHKPNGGLSSARNFGLEIACGQWISFVDSDDILSSSMIEKLLKVTEEFSNCELVVCKHKNFSTDIQIGNCSELEYKNRYETVKNTDRNYFADIRGGMFVWGALYSSNIIKQYNLRFDTSLIALEDVFWNIIFLKNTTKIYYIEDELYFYRTRPDSLSNARPNKLSFAEYWIPAKKAFLNYFSKSKISETNKRYLKKAYRKMQNAFFGELHAQNATYDEYRSIYQKDGNKKMNCPIWLIEPKIEKHFSRLFFSTYMILLKLKSIVGKQN